MDAISMLLAVRQESQSHIGPLMYSLYKLYTFGTTAVVLWFLGPSRALSSWLPHLLTRSTSGCVFSALFTLLMLTNSSVSRSELQQRYYRQVV